MWKGKENMVLVMSVWIRYKKKTTWQPFIFSPFSFLLMTTFMVNEIHPHYGWLWMGAPPRPPRFVWTDGPTYTTDGQVPCFAPFHVLLALPLRVLRKKSSGLKVCPILFWLFFPISGCSQDCRRMIILRCRWLVNGKQKKFVVAGSFAWLVMF